MKMYEQIVNEYAPKALKRLSKKGVSRLEDREDIVFEAIAAMGLALGFNNEIGQPKSYFDRAVDSAFSAWLLTQPMGVDEPIVEEKTPVTKQEKRLARRLAKRRIVPCSFDELSKSQNDDGTDGIDFLDTVEGLSFPVNCKERLNDIRLCAQKQGIELRPPRNSVRKKFLELCFAGLSLKEMSDELGVKERRVKKIKSQYKKCIKALPSFLDGDFTDLPVPMNKSDALFVCYYMLGNYYVQYEGS